MSPTPDGSGLTELHGYRRWPGGWWLWVARRGLTTVQVHRNVATLYALGIGPGGTAPTVDARRTVGTEAVIGKGWFDVSETYTAVYERDGEAWVAEIAEESQVHSRGANVAEVRANIRVGLARRLNTDSDKLHIVDHFRMPAQIRTARETVKTTRTDDERTQMIASMTDSKSAMSWAKELGVSLRDPSTVEFLEGLGDRELSIDTFCHTITMAEDMSRWSVAGDSRSPNGRHESE